jgi:hypothetical protein
MRLRKTLISAAVAAMLSGAAFADNLSIGRLGSYNTGLAQIGETTSGETAALHGNRLYVTNATDVSLDIVDVSNPRQPTLIARVPLQMYGGSVTSVDVSSKNLVAVGVVALTKTDPGTVVFLTPAGNVVGTATVGALPDMVTFTPDGRKLLVANEGEPNCYGTGCIDPEGTVSIVDAVPMQASPPVQTVSFAGVAIPEGVRIFGPGASAAQDLEPEYITVAKDGKTAYVTLQENNAIAVIDIDEAKVTRIHALGYKNFDVAPSLSTYELNDLPRIGDAGGKTLYLGGFSGLFYEGTTRSGKLRFVTHTDRGPNGEPTGVRRPFLLPDFAPEIVRLELNPSNGRLKIKQRIPLRRPDGSLLTGLPNTAVAGGNGNTPYNDEVPVDLFDQVLPLDTLGGDFEGIVVDDNGHFWLCDEYRPAIYHFDADGVLIERFVPIGSAAAVGAAPGTFGTEVLPAVLAQRRQNRGFEALAMQNGKLYAFVQSPARNPATLSNATLNALQNVRLVEFDPATHAVRQFIYIMDNPPATGDDTRADKIGDATALPGGGFLVVERDDDALPEDPLATITKKVYAFDLGAATDITNFVGNASKSLDEMTRDELLAAGVTPIAKVLHVDLASAGYNQVEKVEGLALIDADTIAVVNDNDFGVAGIVIDTANGTFEYAEGYTPEPVLLGIIDTPGLDASDQDNVVNIRGWPLYGMYQPDAVANFTIKGKTYLITANEGDARDYTGDEALPQFTEETRARDIRSKYPPEVAALLNERPQLGRLNVTDVPPGGDRSRPYVFGTRSFSIWSAATGKQVWDSGSELEVRTAAALPRNFNSDNAANNFDNRSDNKGPEPEGIAVGVVDGRTYAFIGLERIGGVMVYDVSNPSAPQFVEYVNNREFADGDVIGPDSGPEVVRFIDAHDSPTGKPMLMVANEITGTVTMWSVKRGGGRGHWHDDDRGHGGDRDRWDDDDRD